MSSNHFKLIHLFALVDCNNFYASCERVFRPALNGKPIVVLSNNDGCVIARSNEAKALDIPMGAPAFKYAQEFKQKDIHVFSSNYALYGDMSNRIMHTLGSFTPDVEVYSIDEAFLRLYLGQYADFDTLGKEMRRYTTKCTGIPISIGIAPTKALSKIANKIAKKFPERTQHVYVLDSDEKREKALKWTAIADVWGIGKGNAARLAKRGVVTAWDFVQLSDDWTLKELSVIGLRLKHELEGKVRLGLESNTGVKKNIMTTRSFETDYTSYEDVKERVITFAVSCAEKLRAQQSCCHALILMLRSNKFKKGEYHRENKIIPLPYPSNSSIELAQFAEQGLQSLFKKGRSYKKAGVIAIELMPEDCLPIKLFENSNPKHKPLMEAVDNLNKQLGSQKVKLATQDLDRTWKMKQEHLSPRYTTQLSDIIEVKV